MSPCAWIPIIGVCLIAVSYGLAWLTINWWLPHTKIETNGIRYRVMQLNRFRIWQEYGNYGKLETAEWTAKSRVTEWHEEHDKYRPLETHERVAAKITYFNERK